MSGYSPKRVSVQKPAKATADFAAVSANSDDLVSRIQMFLVTGSNSQSIVTGTFVPLSFASVTYDSSSWWSGGNPTRFTVPTGIILAQCTIYFSWSGLATNGSAYMRKNGASFMGVGDHCVSLELGGSITSSLVTCIPGDYFEFMTTHASGGNLTLTYVISVRGWK